MKLSGYVLLKISQDAPRNVRIRIYKVMNGTVVTIKGKRYKSKGLVELMDGIKINGSLYVFPLENITKLLRELSGKGLDTFVEIINMCTCKCD
ncbi:MAG: hypothetical protein QXT53_01295 [Ignisphaera sp.]